MKKSVQPIFDPGEDSINRDKHGVSLALADLLFPGPHLSVADDRFDYDEQREITFGFIGSPLFVCVHVTVARFAE
jgi:hypothetical protein